MAKAYIVTDINREHQFTPDERRALRCLVAACDKLNRVYFAQRGGSILLDWEKRPHAAYPKGLKPADLARLVAGTSQEEDVLDPETMVFGSRRSRFRTVPYHVHFAEELGEVALEIRRARQAIKKRHPTFAAYLQQVEKSIQSGNWQRADDAALRAGGPLWFYLYPSSTADDHHGKQTFEAMLAVRRRPTEREQIVTDHFPEFAKGLMTRFFPDADMPIRRTKVQIMNTLALGGSSLYVGKFMASMIDYWRSDGETVHALCVSRNMIAANYDESSKKIIKAYMKKHRLRGSTFEGAVLGTLAHEFGHTIPMDFTLPQFGRHGAALEELKADVFGLLFLMQLVQDGRLSRKMGRDILTTFIAELLGYTYKPYPKWPYYRMAAVQLDRLFAAGVVQVSSKQVVLRLYPQKVAEVYEQLAGELATLWRQPSLRAARDTLTFDRRVMKQVQRLMRHEKEGGWHPVFVF